MCKGLVAALFSDICTCELRVYEECLGVLDAALNEILHKTHTKIFFVEMLKIGFAHANFVCAAFDGVETVIATVHSISDGREQLKVIGCFDRSMLRANLFADMIAQEGKIMLNVALFMLMIGIVFTGNGFDAKADKIGRAQRDRRLICKSQIQKGLCLLPFK